MSQMSCATSMPTVRRVVWAAARLVNRCAAGAGSKGATRRCLTCHAAPWRQRPCAADPLKCASSTPICDGAEDPGCHAGGASNCRWCGFRKPGLEVAHEPCPGEPPKTQLEEWVALPLYCPTVCSDRPQETCYFDGACAVDVLGCGAGGMGPHCRFCGFGDYADIPCPDMLASTRQLEADVQSAMSAAVPPEVQAKLQADVVFVSTAALSLGGGGEGATVLDADLALQAAAKKLLCRSSGDSTSCSVKVTRPEASGRRLNSVASVATLTHTSVDPLDAETQALQNNQPAFGAALVQGIREEGGFDDVSVSVVTVDFSLQVRAFVVLDSSGSASPASVEAALKTASPVTSAMSAWLGMPPSALVVSRPLATSATFEPTPTMLGLTSNETGKSSAVFLFGAIGGGVGLFVVVIALYVRSKWHVVRARTASYERHNEPSRPSSPSPRACDAAIIRGFGGSMPPHHWQAGGATKQLSVGRGGLPSPMKRDLSKGSGSAGSGIQIVRPSEMMSMKV